MLLILKVATINAVGDSVLRHPLSMIKTALSSNSCHFGIPSKVHLYPLPLVIIFGHIRGMTVEPSFARSIYIAKLRNRIMFHSWLNNRNNFPWRHSCYYIFFYGAFPTKRFFFNLWHNLLC